jgi:hypothetical protein
MVDALEQLQQAPLVQLKIESATVMAIQMQLSSGEQQMFSFETRNAV